MLLLQLQLLLQKHLKPKSTRNLGLNHLNLGDGPEIEILQILEYSYCLIPSDHRHYNAQNLDFVETYHYRTDAFTFKYSFFPYTSSEWNKLDSELSNAKSYSVSRRSLLMFGLPGPNLVYRIRDLLYSKIASTYYILAVLKWNQQKTTNSIT